MALSGIDDIVPSGSSVGTGAAMTALSSTEVELFSVAGLDGYLRQVNAAFAMLLGVDAIRIEGTSVLELVHPEDVPAVVEALAALGSGAGEVVVETRFRHQESGWVHLQWVARPVPGTDLWWASGRDITEFHQLLSERTALWARLQLATGPAVAMWDLDVPSDAMTWEGQGQQLFGPDPDALPTTITQLLSAVHPGDLAVVTKALEDLRETGAFELGLRLGQDTEQDPQGPGRGRDVQHVSFRAKVLTRDRRGRPRQAVGILVDVSTEKALEEQMMRLVLSDALTGVPNRRAFDQALRSECRRASRGVEPVSLLMIDLDDFKGFNDSFGHLVGDEALCALTRALTAHLARAGDFLARFGGEEFAVVLPGTDVDGALAVGQRLVAAARSITVHQAAGRRLSVSVGTATWIPDGTPAKPAVLVARADQALYAAKAAGKDQALAWEHAVAERDRLETAIADGLNAGQFELYYQPIVELASGEVAGVEALIRWNRPGHGMVSPDEFIPVAERTTLICDMGRWVLGQACDQLADWARQGLDRAGGLRMAVNMSARHVNSPAIVTDVQHALTRSGIPPHQLELELTETAMTNRLAAYHLSQLRDLGVTIAIDDFGTGYTSIGHLPDLPVDVLKIDRSFVASTQPRHQSLVTLMVGAAHAFDLTVVAEGIEDTATLDLMRTMGCHRAQGYHFARPMPSRTATSWLTDRQ
jgi:diguanylate cyclase (GGDEF)-like protein/PAS domain S-box-containing protein